MSESPGSLHRQARSLGLLFLTLAVGMPGLVQPVSARDEPAPVFEAVNQPGVSQNAEAMEQRLSRLERQMDNQVLVELMSSIDRFQQEIQQLVGQIEEQDHSLEGLKKRQRDLYLDIDQRLRVLEEARTSAATTPMPAPEAAPANSAFANSGAPSAPTAGDTEGAINPTVSAAPAASAQPAQADSQLERKNYELAFNLLKEGRYDQAVAAFQAFLETYPSGRFADNAQYWLGEANYVQRRFNDALTEFDKVVKINPESPKRADAMLKMGYTYQELGDFEKARVLLNDVIRNYPNSTAANLAKKRLQDFKLLQ